jgi:hypothetical protein
MAALLDTILVLLNHAVSGGGVTPNSASTATVTRYCGTVSATPGQTRPRGATTPGSAGTLARKATHTRSS